MQSDRDVVTMRERLWLGSVVGLGILLRLGALAALPHVPEGDELAYKSMAAGLVGGYGLVDNWGNRAMYNVAYPLLVLSPLFALFGQDLLFPRLANLALGVVVILLTHSVAAEAGAGRTGRLLASAVAALYLPASIYVVYLFKENLLAPLMLGVTWCSLRLLRSPTVSVAVLCGALFGLIALTGNSALALIGATSLALIKANGPAIARLSLFAVVGLFAASIAAPWIARNAEVVGEPVLNTNGGFNLYLGNNPSATGEFISIAETPRGSTWEELLLKEGEAKAVAILRADALNWIKENPADAIALAARKAFLFWKLPMHSGKGTNSNVEVLIRALWSLQFVAIVSLATAWIAIASLRTDRIFVLATAVVCYAAIHLPFYVVLRYREPIMPILGVLAALSVEAIIELHKARTLRRASEIALKS